MTSDEQRAAFEAWICTPPYSRLNAERLGRIENDQSVQGGQYKDMLIQLAWEAWQASHEHDKNTENTEHPLRGTTLWRPFEDS